MIDMRQAWSQAPIEAERLENAGITNELIDSALSAFILEIILNHGKVNKKIVDYYKIFLKTENTRHIYKE